MDQKTLGAIAICVVVIMVIVIIVGSAEGGLPSDLKDQYQREKSQLASTAASLDQERQTIEKLLKKHEKELAPIAQREQWQASLDAATTRLEEARSRYDKEAKPLFDANLEEDTPKLSILLQQISTERSRSVARPREIREAAQGIVAFVENRDEYITRARKDAAAVKGLSLVSISDKVAQAQTDWPEKKADLDERLKSLTEYPSRADALLQEVETKAKADASAVDVGAFIGLIDSLQRLSKTAPSAVSSLSSLIDQLYVSYDKILEDMEIREGRDVEFYHLLRIIRVDREDKATDTKEWTKVSKSTYDKHEKNLGMTLESKPKGKYDSEAVKVASPPGYSYVGNKKYGQWEQRSGGSFWVWYGQYRFMSDLFWGPRMYSPIPYTTYHDYRGYRDSGRAYYGSGRDGKAKYGSKGSFTNSRYSSSKYVKSSGYKNSQYMKSGGKYKGSRFASSRSQSSGSRYSSSRSRSSSSSSSYRRGSRSSGGSRSFGK